MRALFSTRCGCQQVFDISCPPLREIVLYLHPSRVFTVHMFDSLSSALPGTPTDLAETRRFVLVESGHPRGPLDTAYYVEE